MFENHANTLSDTNEEVRQSLQNLRLSSTQQASSSKAKDSDQICVYKETDGRRRVCMVIEYKPSHKLSDLSHMQLLSLLHILATPCFYANPNSHIYHESLEGESGSSTLPPPFQSTERLFRMQVDPEFEHPSSADLPKRLGHSGLPDYPLLTGTSFVDKHVLNG
jgi:hypothetical protein